MTKKTQKLKDKYTIHMTKEAKKQRVENSANSDTCCMTGQLIISCKEQLNHQRKGSCYMTPGLLVDLVTF